MGGGEDKEANKRDREAFALVSQYFTFRQASIDQAKDLTKELKLTVSSSEVRHRIKEIGNIIDNAGAMGIIDKKKIEGKLLFQRIGRLRDEESNHKFYIPYINQILGDIHTCLQICSSNIANWERVLGGKTIEKALEHSELFVQKASIPVSQGTPVKPHDDDEDAGQKVI